MQLIKKVIVINYDSVIILNKWKENSMLIQKSLFMTFIYISLCGYSGMLYAKKSLPLQAEQGKYALDRQKLTRDIEEDLYCMFVLEMGIISRDWKEMAQGNEKLEEDLKNLYRAFNSSVEEARAQLKKFCKTWQLDIKMGRYEQN